MPASASSFNSTTTANPTFTAANVSADTIANISLTVSDGELSDGELSDGELSDSSVTTVTNDTSTGTPCVAAFVPGHIYYTYEKFSYQGHNWRTLIAMWTSPTAGQLHWFEDIGACS
ncbi:MAG: hypothetical protein HRT51_15440 [Colwellia sp.]|nr:hypothetical protein [Colwellia sp.]